MYIYFNPKVKSIYILRVKGVQIYLSFVLLWICTTTNILKWLYILVEGSSSLNMKSNAVIWHSFFHGLNVIFLFKSSSPHLHTLHNFIETSLKMLSCLISLIWTPVNIRSNWQLVNPLHTGTEATCWDINNWNCSSNLI